MIWYVANAVIYYLSIALKKPVIFESFLTVSLLFLWLYYTVIGIFLFLIGISLLLNRQFLWLVIYIFIGSSIIGWFFSIIQMPFLFIQSYFATKLENFNFEDNTLEGEVLDKNNKIIGKTESDSAISIRLARYFILFYLINFVLIIFPKSNAFYQWSDYLVTPFLQIIGDTIIIGVPYAIYHKIRYKNFMQSDKRYFLIKIWKTWVIISVILVILTLIQRIIFSL